MGIIRDLIIAFFLSKKEKHIITTTTIYEPDKVRIAEIEAMTQKMVKVLEAQNIKLSAELTKELNEHWVKTEQLLIKAKNEGFANLINNILEISEKVIRNRIIFMENVQKGSILNEKEIWSIYIQIRKKLNEEAERFEFEYLPKLEEQKNKYEKGSDSYELYSNIIHKKTEQNFIIMKNDIDFWEHQLGRILTDNNETKNIIEKHINEINNKILEVVDNATLLFGKRDDGKNILDTVNHKLEKVGISKKGIARANDYNLGKSDENERTR